MRRRPQRLLALALVFAAGLGFTLLPTTHSARADNVCTPDASWGTNNASFASQVISLVNQHRASMGLGQLSVDGALSRSAVWKSMNMAGLNYFAHDDTPIGRTVAQRFAACGWPSNLGWGENIAYGFQTPAAVMAGWLSSPGHKANIENPSFTSTGVGVAANAQGVYYWTQDFGQGSSGGAPPPPTTTAPPPPATTSPPATTAPPPVTTSKAPTTTSPPPATTSAQPPSTTGEVPVARAPADAAAPAVAKAKKAHKAHKAKKAHRARKARRARKRKLIAGSAFVVRAPRGFLNLKQRRHL